MTLPLFGPAERPDRAAIPNCVQKAAYVGLLNAICSDVQRPPTTQGRGQSGGGVRQVSQKVISRTGRRTAAAQRPSG